MAGSRNPHQEGLNYVWTLILISITLFRGYGIDEQELNEIITFTNARSMPSGVHGRLLGHHEMFASDNPPNLSIISDSIPSASLYRGSNSYLEAVSEIRSTTARPSGEDYTPMIMWDPMCLYKGVLYGFCALYTAPFVALVLLYNFSSLGCALSTRISRNEYSWTLA